jgi:hypothetical protein
MAEDFLLKVGKDNRENESEETPKQPEKPQEDGKKPSENKKYLKSCGCGCLVLILAFAGLMYWANSIVQEEERNDLRITYLKQDVARLTTDVPEENIITSMVKTCIDSSIFFESEDKNNKKEEVEVINKSEIEYFTRLNENKLLIILKVEGLGDVEASTRKVFVNALLECFSYVEDDLGIDEYYISLEGFWNTLLVYTPKESDLGGKFADNKLLLPFYNEYVKDSLPSLE